MTIEIIEKYQGKMIFCIKSHDQTLNLVSKLQTNAEKNAHCTFLFSLLHAFRFRMLEITYDMFYV